MTSRDLALYLLCVALVRVGALIDGYVAALATTAAIFLFAAVTDPAWTLALREERERREMNQGSEPK